MISKRDSAMLYIDLIYLTAFFDIYIFLSICDMKHTNIIIIYNRDKIKSGLTFTRKRLSYTKFPDARLLVGGIVKFVYRGEKSGADQIAIQGSVASESA